jgi:hypothetical protein
MSGDLERLCFSCPFPEPPGPLLPLWIQTRGKANLKTKTEILMEKGPQDRLRELGPWVSSGHS